MTKEQLNLLFEYIDKAIQYEIANQSSDFWPQYESRRKEEAQKKLEESFDCE